LPDRFTGALTVSDFSGGVSPYFTRITLDSAAVQGESFMTDFDSVGLNLNFEFEITYTEIPGGRYEVEIMDDLGCVFSVPARIPVNRDIFIPNIFTPNGDNYNEVFFVRNLPEEGSQLIVNSRWGTEVFSSDNYQNDWDGGDTPDGIYFYKLETPEGQVYTGWVEILRGSGP
ncbi:MAG: gliding motility-associated C-terminal domain-containing protein, partial [Fulvivirga sp.]|nr:gliding motility-associated C-terminal domain-containing protein [Fulvivirga sp.]